MSSYGLSSVCAQGEMGAGAEGLGKERERDVVSSSSYKDTSSMGVKASFNLKLPP